MGAWARPEEGQGQQAAHLAQSTDTGPHGGLGAALGHNRPGEEKDGCLDKDRFQGLGASESLSASPGVLSGQGIHTAHPPPPPITQPGVIHLLVICPLRSLPSWDPLTATVGIQTPGWSQETLQARDHSHSMEPLAITHRSPLSPSVGAIFNPQSPNPWVGTQFSGFQAQDHGRLAPQSRSRHTGAQGGSATAAVSLPGDAPVGPPTSSICHNPTA